MLTAERSLPKREPWLPLAVRAQPGKQRYPQDIVILQVPDNDGKGKATFAGTFCWVFCPQMCVAKVGRLHCSPSYLGDTEVQNLL